MTDGLNPKDSSRPEFNDLYGRTALIQAVLSAKLDLVVYILRESPAVDAQDDLGYTALHYAAQNYLLEIAEALLKAGARVDVQDNYGNSPLWRAVFNSRGRGDVIKLLLSYGADVELKNKSGKSPRELANTIANYDVKQFIPLAKK
jgi:ankyrin repeat protein